MSCLYAYLVTLLPAVICQSAHTHTHINRYHAYARSAWRQCDSEKYLRTSILYVSTTTKESTCQCCFLSPPAQPRPPPALSIFGAHNAYFRFQRVSLGIFICILSLSSLFDLISWNIYLSFRFKNSPHCVGEGWKFEFAASFWLCPALASNSN